MRIVHSKNTLKTFIPCLLATAVLIGCIGASVTAIDLLTGERREFISEDAVPAGWTVCASDETCPEPHACAELAETACVSRADCRAVYLGLGVYHRGCDESDPSRTCDGRGFVECTDAPIAICAPDACGPPLGAPSYECADGSIGGNTGRCIPDDSGTCGWEIRECPPVADCSPEECGVGYGGLPYECSDGSVGGPTGRCLRDSAGACGWEFLECPPVDDCSPEECGVGYGGLPYECSDGSAGGPTGRCLRDSAGACGWEFLECPDDA